MVPALVLGVALLFGFLLLGRWYVQATPGQILTVVRWFAIVVGAGLLLFIIIGGRWGWLPGLLFIALPWLNRLNAVRTFARNARGPSPGQSSGVDTEFLSMSLDHDTGEMDGTVTKGSFAGRTLSSMTMAEHVDLYRECTDDERSAAVLAAYLDRIHGAEWHDAAGDSGDSGPAGGSARSAGSGMTRDEAFAVLGLDSGADEAAIEAAYRQLMLRMHPDHGGSDYLAAKLNQAKDLLLGR